MGYASERDFLDSVEREMAAMEIHSNRPGARPGQPNEQATPGFRLRGEPMSKERWKQVAHLVGPQNQHLLNEIGRREKGNEVFRAVKAVQEDPSRDNLAYAARLVAELEDVNVARAAISAIQPTGAVDHFVSALVDASDVVEQRKAEHDEAAERRRLAERQELLAREYERVQRHPEQAEAVDAMAQGLGDLMYHPEMADDEARVLLRSQAEAAKGQRKALDDFAFLSSLESEFARYGPAGVDEHRIEYERGMKEAALEVFDRHNPTAEQAAAAAVDSVAHERAFGDKPAIEVFLEREFENMALHDSRAPHKVAMRDENVRDFHDHYDEVGRPRR